MEDFNSIFDNKPKEYVNVKKIDNLPKKIYVYDLKFYVINVFNNIDDTVLFLNNKFPNYKNKTHKQGILRSINKQVVYKDMFFSDKPLNDFYKEIYNENYQEDMITTSKTNKKYIIKYHNNKFYNVSECARFLMDEWDLINKKILNFKKLSHIIKHRINNKIHDYEDNPDYENFDFENIIGINMDKVKLTRKYPIGQFINGKEIARYESYSEIYQNFNGIKRDNIYKGVSNALYKGNNFMGSEWRLIK